MPNGSGAGSRSERVGNQLRAAAALNAIGPAAQTDATKAHFERHPQLRAQTLSMFPLRGSATFATTSARSWRRAAMTCNS